MAWVTIKGPFGRKLVEPGYILQPWESIEKIERTASDDALSCVARHFGMDVADFVEWAARSLGISPCPRCQMSKRVLYKMHEIGWLRGIGLLWHIRWKRALTFEEVNQMSGLWRY